MPTAQPDPTYTREAIQRRLNTLIIGKEIEVRSQVDSTNDLVREAGRRGAPEGLVVIAEEQVRGRGRLGRTWVAPPGSSILCSVLLRPRFSPQQAFYLTIATSLAILRGIRRTDDGRRTTGGVGGSPVVRSEIKWPNDVLLNGRKVSGVLCESEFSGGDWAFAVVGFGINANLPSDSFGDLSDRATSISAELGHEVSRAVLVARVLTELEACYLAMQNGQFHSIYASWVSSLETLGRQVSVDYGQEQLTGQALRVDPDGSLVIKTPEGLEISVLAGDIV
jgi:BirA family biotin operon repressor/biotin-[acetyl-CoA-carboxylase] ligase